MPFDLKHDKRIAENDILFWNSRHRIGGNSAAAVILQAKISWLSHLHSVFEHDVHRHDGDQVLLPSGCRNNHFSF